MKNVLIVGAGLSGATLAHLIAVTYPDVHVHVIDKRAHVAGNVYDYVDELTGIRVSKYGAHLFHTNDTEVWQFVQQFGEWQRWDHTVVAKIDDSTYVPIPVNATTINTLTNSNLTTAVETQAWLAAQCPPCTLPFKNSEEVALARVGPTLYKQLFYEYTMKQWNKAPHELDPSVLQRIPVNYGFDNRYFNDKYQALPRNGYTALVENMLNHTNVTVKLNTPWDAVDKTLYDEIIFTGPIDTYFPDLPKLEYRSIKFEQETVACPGYMLPNSVVNYPSAAVPYTRTVEYKHFLHQKSPWTILVHEQPTDEGEPYYPLPTSRNQALYAQYQELAAQETHVHFVGRLANYKYFNMDQAIRNAMDYFAANFATKETS